LADEISELELLRVRDEVLQAMYWMRSEGLFEAPSERDLASFLAVAAEVLSPFLERFAADGLLERADGGYRLTSSGEDAGKRAFAMEFADLTRPTHGDCDEDCWCHSSPEEAARCLEERAARAV
jgi:hypothetical protein